jgi:hypothetical protein
VQKFVQNKKSDFQVLSNIGLPVVKPWTILAMSNLQFGFIKSPKVRLQGENDSFEVSRTLSRT